VAASPERFRDFSTFLRLIVRNFTSTAKRFQTGIFVERRARVPPPKTFNEV
jgi:hypothetical protein